MLEERQNRSKGNSVPTPYSVKQLKTFFSVVDSPKMALACWLALRTGMRKTEVFTTKISEIEWELQRINKPRTKGGKPRVYYLDDRAMSILKRWVSMLGDTEYLFPSTHHNKKHVDKMGFYNEFVKYLKKAGLFIENKEKKCKTKRHVFNFHTFRTTFCSILINANTPIFVTKELMGHSKVSTTERHYAYMGDVRLRDEINRVFGKHKNPILSQEAREKVQNIVEYRQEVSQAFSDNRPLPTTEDPLQILKIKLARGEMGIEEFRQRVAVMRETEDKSILKREFSYIG